MLSLGLGVGLTDWRRPLGSIVARVKAGDSLAALGGVTAFSRADATTCAQYTDSTATQQLALANVLRDAHYVGGIRTILLESTAKNLVIQSDALHTTWFQQAGVVSTNAVGTYAGRPFSRLAYAVNWATDFVRSAANIGFTGNAVKVMWLLAKKDGANAGTFEFFIKDTSAGQDRLDVVLTVAANGVISAAAVVGTVLETIALADGVYAFKLRSTAATAANTNRPYIGAGIGTCPSILLSGIDIRDASFLTSPIATAAAQVIRATDALTLGGVAGTGPATLFYRYFDLATVAWANLAAPYTFGNPITPAVDRAYADIVILEGTFSTALAAAMLGY